MCNTSRHGVGVKDDVQAQQTNTRTRRSGVLTVMDRPPGKFFYSTNLSFFFWIV